MSEQNETRRLAETLQAKLAELPKYDVGFHWEAKNKYTQSARFECGGILANFCMWIVENRSALEAALTAPDKQEAEPVAWTRPGDLDLLRNHWPIVAVIAASPEEAGDNTIPLFTTPARSDDALRAENERLRRVLADPCVNKLAADEPFFVLLGRDPDASHALSTWISYRLRREGPSEKTRAAEATLDAFREHQDAALTSNEEG